MTDDSKESARISRRDTGITMTGGLAATGASMALGALGVPLSPIAAPIVNALVSRGLRKLAADMAQRQLSDRERQRVEEVIEVAQATIERNLEEGKRPRADWQKPPWPGEPSPDAAEITEGVLVAAQRQHESRKVAILGRILGNLAFTPQVDRDYANALVRTAGELSYRQFCLLKLLTDAEITAHNLPSKILVADGTGPVVGLLTDMLDLHRRTMVQQRNQDDTEGVIVLTAFQIEPNRLRTVTGPGGWIFELGELATSIPEDDLRTIADLLHAYAAPPPDL